METRKLFVRVHLHSSIKALQQILLCNAVVIHWKSLCTVFWRLRYYRFPVKIDECKLPVAHFSPMATNYETSLWEYIY